MVNRELMAELKARLRPSEGFGALARYLREREGLSRRALANAMGCDDAYGVYIRQVEISQDLQSPAMMAKYSGYFSISLPYVIQFDEADMFKHCRRRVTKRVERSRYLLDRFVL